MTQRAGHNEPWRHVWKTVVPVVMALVLVLSFTGPAPTFASGPGVIAPSSALVDVPGHHDGAQTDRADLGLTQHTHCTCHSVVRFDVGVSYVRRATPNVLLLRIEAAPSPAPSSLPFKPPRSA
jgi:hypothetical protein